MIPNYTKVSNVCICLAYVHDPEKLGQKSILDYKFCSDLHSLIGAFPNAAMDSVIKEVDNCTQYEDQYVELINKVLTDQCPNREITIDAESLEISAWDETYSDTISEAIIYDLVEAFELQKNYIEDYLQ